MAENQEPIRRSSGRFGRILKSLLILAVVGFVAMLGTVIVATQIYASRGTDDIRRGAADVMIILSAGVDRHGVELDEFTKARIETAVELYFRGAAPYLLMSGGRYSEDASGNIAERMKAFAIERGVQPRAIFIEGNSISTFQNARFTFEVICERHSDLSSEVWCEETERRRRPSRNPVWRTAILVTDDYHMLRASTLFDYWRQPSDIEIVAYAPSNGRADAGVVREAIILLRETLAVPFNVLKMTGQVAVDAVGLGEQIEIR